MTNLTRRGRNANNAARLPALAAQTQVTDVALRNFLEGVREYLEVRLGSRGDFYERAVTHRELREQVERLEQLVESADGVAEPDAALASLRNDLRALQFQVRQIQNQWLTSIIGGNTQIQNILNQLRDIAIEEVSVYASHMRPSVTGGCSALTTIEFASTQPNFHALLFDQTTDESCDFPAILPRAWAGKMFRMRVYWGHGTGATSFTVRWAFQANSTSDNETVILDFVDPITVDDTGGTGGHLYIAETAQPIPIASNYNADGDFVSIRLSRRNSGVGGNLNADAALLAVQFVLADVLFTPDIETEAFWDSGTQGGGWTLSESNMRADCTWGVAVSNIKAIAGRTTGKRYFEVLLNDVTVFHTGVRHDIGVTTVSGTMPTGGSFANNGAGTETGAGYRIGGKIFVNGVDSGSPAALADADVVGVAVDLDTGDVWFSRNGTWTQGDPGAGTSPEGTIASTASTYFPAISAESGADLDASLRTAEAQFSYPIPTGFVSWANDL